jgi:predicted ester cyclase
MSPVQLTWTIRRMFDEVANRGNLDILDEIYAPHFVNHNALPGTPTGIEGVRQSVMACRRAFPDWQETIDNIRVKDDKIVVMSTVRATHKGQWRGIAPTGRRITARRVSILRAVNGKIVERWGSQDDFSLMRQIGAFPTRQQLFMALAG